jgi:SPP1 gp7 family putative phage head morphogenesis protein
MATPVREAARRTALYVRNMQRLGNATKRRRPPKPRWPFGLERIYAEQLVSVVTDLKSQVGHALRDIGPILDAAIAARGERVDAADRICQRIGLTIRIENRAGSKREWTDSDGTRGSTRMLYDYGELVDFIGADGEGVDVFIGPSETPLLIYVIHQRSKRSDFATYDEDKVMIGWDSADAARAAYVAQYDDPRFFGGMSSFTIDDFKRRLRESPGRSIVHVTATRETRLDVGEGARARNALDRVRENGSGARASRLAEQASIAIARRVADDARDQLSKQSVAALGVDTTPLLANKGVPAMMEHFVAENVALIKTLGTTALGDVEKLVTRAVTDGMTADSLGKLFEERFGIHERHARLIARDQIGKLKGQITRAQHRELGIARFRWLTMRDPKVRRRHRPHEGKIYSYEGDQRPPFFPGMEICCRCLEEPMFDDVMAELDALLAADAPAPTQRRARPVPRFKVPVLSARAQGAANDNLRFTRRGLGQVAAVRSAPIAPPIDISPSIQAERARLESSSVAAKAAAAEDLAAFADHQKKQAAEQAAAAAALAAKRSAAAKKGAATRAAKKAAAAAAPPAPTGAIRYGAMSPADFAGFHGRGFVQDSDAIEGGSVRVVKVSGANGEYFEAVFKVTSPYGNTARKFGPDRAPQWSFRKRDLVNGELRDTGPTQEMPNPAQVRRGAKSTVEIGASGALTNQVRIRAKSLSDLDATMQEFSGHLGVDLSKQPDRADIELQAKARLAAKFDPKEFGRRMQGAATPAEQRDIVESVFAAQVRQHPMLKDALADVKITEVYPGHHTLYSETLGKHMAKKWGSMYHDGDPPAAIAAKIVGQSGLMSSVKRYQSGVFTTGMSTSDDFGTGGADGVFMRVDTAASPSGSNGSNFRAVIDTKQVMGRLDWWAFDHDNYGRAGYGQYGDRWSIPQQMMTSSPNGTNEVMATHGVPPSAFKKFIVPDPTYRNEVLVELRRQGINEINGVPVADFVVQR